MSQLPTKRVAIIVAHPDDETLWAGGMILSHPLWQCFIVCLCRSSDEERATRFYQTLYVLNATGAIGNLDDEVEQKPLSEEEVESAILDLLPSAHFDLLITHNPDGEYTKHIRHEEVSKAVINLWHQQKISADELWTFAYEDGGKKYYPHAVRKAPVYQVLDKKIWLEKHRIITETYGFDLSSWEAKTTPDAEAFWQFSNSSEAIKWLEFILK